MEPDVKQMTINCYSWQNSGSLQFQIYCKYMVFYQTNQETCLLNPSTNRLLPALTITSQDKHGLTRVQGHISTAQEPTYYTMFKMKSIGCIRRENNCVETVNRCVILG